MQRKGDIVTIRSEKTGERARTGLVLDVLGHMLEDPLGRRHGNHVYPRTGHIDGRGTRTQDDACSVDEIVGDVVSQSRAASGSLRS